MNGAQSISSSTPSACWHLFKLTLCRQLFSRQTLASLALSMLCILIAVASSRHSDPSAKRLAEQVLIPAFIIFLMPVYAICYGASAISGEREDRTLIYLLITSLPRPLIYLMKALASLSLVAVCSMVTLWLTCRAAGEPGRELFSIFCSAALLGGLAYASLFMLLGAVFRYGTIISLVYWFFLEVLFGNLPGIIKRVSIAFYVRCMIYDAAGPLNLGPPGKTAREMFLPVSGSVSAIVLASLGVLLLAAGLVAFEYREYRDLN